MLTSRANAICILDILKEYSDEDNILTMADIINKMNSIYGVKIDRRTVYSAIGLLIELGYDISIYEDNGIGYFLQTRDFEQSEVLLLTNAVYSFPFISSHQTEELIKKLQKQLSVCKRKQYRHLTIARKDKKTDNKQIFWNIEVLDNAIQNQKQVEFSYLTYGLDKKLHLRREKSYIVNPYAMIYTNEHYYLISNSSRHEGTTSYRIDFIKDIKILENNADMQFLKKEEFENTVYAFAGKPEKIKMYCDKRHINDVIDKFGTEITIVEKDDKNFIASFTASPDGIEYWALQYLPYVEVVEPQSLRETIINSIKQNRYGVNN